MQTRAGDQLAGEDTTPPWRAREFHILAAGLILTIATGSAFYTLVEGWSVLNAAYFSVVTLATVGYGDLSPATPAGKLFTMAYIMVGIGLLAGFANAVAKRWVDRRIRRAGLQPPTRGIAQGRRARRRFRRVR
jgi:voltage-gated potassium channel Kch